MEFTVSPIIRSGLAYQTRRASSSALLSFVPQHEPVTNEDVQQLEQLIRASPSVVVLTGAGISTECGLPDYRSEKVGLFARTKHQPITIQEFVNSESRRRIYWARNFVAWEKFSSFEPGIAHKTLSEWQKKGKVTAIITQNVDRLHQKAGSKDVIELHGNGFIVRCLTPRCNYTIERSDFQKELSLLNSGWHSTIVSTAMRPDGDVQLNEVDAEAFRVPSCPLCRGLLKPKIVFFGENVPRSAVDKCHDLVKRTDLLLVIGSSLYVYSGYRLVEQANDLKKKIAIVNIGPTRADDIKDILIFRRRAGEILPKVKL